MGIAVMPFVCSSRVSVSRLTVISSTNAPGRAINCPARGLPYLELKIRCLQLSCPRALHPRGMQIYSWCLSNTVLLSKYHSTYIRPVLFPRNDTHEQKTGTRGPRLCYPQPQTTISPLPPPSGAHEPRARVPRL